MKRIKIEKIFFIVKSKKIDNITRANLISEYLPDIVKLENLIKKDLSIWKQ